MLKKFKSRGYTDTLYICNLLFTWMFTIVCILLTGFQSILNITDFSIICYGLPVVWGELSVHTGFIVWKSKEENMAKHNSEYIPNVEEDNT